MLSYATDTKFNQNRFSHFLKIKILIFFLCELPLILGLGGKLNKTARDIYGRTPDIDFERDRSIGLGCTFGDGQTDTHTDIFSKPHFYDVEVI